MIFASSVGTYGLDMTQDTIDDYTLQRPQYFYGVTKLFGELNGPILPAEYGLDFRGVRYPPIVGPGIKTPGAAQYAGWVIEESAKGRPFTVWVRPDTPTPVMYYKDAASALVQLAAAPMANIQMGVYVVAGSTPTAQQIADAVRRRIPRRRSHFARILRCRHSWTKYYCRSMITSRGRNGAGNRSTVWRKCWMTSSANCKTTPPATREDDSRQTERCQRSVQAQKRGLKPAASSGTSQ